MPAVDAEPLLLTEYVLICVQEDDPKEILVTLKASSASDMKSWIEALDSHSESLNRSLGPDLEFASKIESVRSLLPTVVVCSPVI